MNQKITHWLSQTSSIWFTVYASLSVFCLYTCIFAFRKTFSAATFEGLIYAGISYKVWLITFQVLGYTVSKFIGIKIIAELKARSRALGILLMVGIASIAWLLFALFPAPYNIVFLFFNGLPLGMVWGMVMGYLEGRRVTEVLGASLSVSFIFSAGLCRSVGAYLIQDWHLTEYWMPFTASCIFLFPMLIFLYLLDQLPPPNADDEKLRAKRMPMNKDDRKKFIATFLPGIVLFVIAYILLTAFRDFRDNFSAEIWKSLHMGNNPSIYTTTETPISIAILICMGSLILIKNNPKALLINHIIIIIGMLLIGLGNYLFQQFIITPTTWMILIGSGLYLGYIPFNSTFFDRLIATFQYTSTVGFIMYLADSFGYLGSIAVLFFKEFGFAELSWVSFFISSGYIISVTGTLLIIGSMIYFYLKYKNWQPITTK